MGSTRTRHEHDENRRDFYRRCIDVLQEAGVPFLVGGACAIELYTGVSRPTKDFDVFVRRESMDGALEAFERAGYRAELTFPHWLGKAFSGDDYIDVIYSSGNGLATVDDEWFQWAREAEVLDREVRLTPPEEAIWSKAFIMERERYDGADVAHIIESMGEELDWRRLVRRFGSHWRVLASHLTLFGYIYPSRRDAVPAWVMRTMCERLAGEVNDEPPAVEVCRGTVLSRAQYLTDVERGRLLDGRLAPFGAMTEEQVEDWTAAMDEER
ncbi:MAG TPA: nucleotidyltransferase [Thermoanaerobaculia bacterium]|nr:nucleotidyltransferase [Thermoanaerobaculia bacterium]